MRPSRLVVAPRNGDEQWITGPVNAQLGILPLVRVEPTPGGPAYWGTSKLVEAVVCPADPDGLARELMQSRRLVGLPLVRRADRPLAVPAVRPSRPSARAAPPQQGART